LPQTGPFAAAFEEAEFREETAIIPNGDMLVLFTDGVTEAHLGNTSIMLGDDQLEALVKEHRELNVYELTDVIFKAVEEYDGGNHADDITTLILRRT
jgi:sigma-B regulation protein RsbU (phosphoserine phosphatase)